MRQTTLLAAGVALAATAALAQDDRQENTALGTEDARGFIDGLGDAAETAVQEGDWQGIAGWMAEHVSADAPIAIESRFLMSQGPAGSLQMSMTGADLHRFAQMAAMGAQGQMSEALSEYRFETRIGDAWQIPGGKVGLAVTFYETGQIDMAQMHGAGGAEAGAGGTEAAGDDDPVAAVGVFSSKTDCAMRLGGTAEDIVIEMAACEVYTML